MNLRSPLILLATTVFSTGALCGGAAKSERTPVARLNRKTGVDFDREVLPVLRNNCLACHNKSTTKGGLVLETPQDMLKGGDSGPAIVPKRGGASLLLKAASHQDEDLVMPPPGNKVQAVDLTSEELGLIKLWIDQGARVSTAVAKPIEWQPLPEGLNPIYAVALTPDGQFAACARANQIFIYHLPSGRLVDRLTDPNLFEAGRKQGTAHRDLVQSLAFHPDGTLLASGSFREVKLWRRPENVRKLSLASVAPKGVEVLTVSPDGKWLATAGDDQVIRLWNLSDGRSVRKLTAHKAVIKGLRFSPDSARLASGSDDKTIRIWSIPGGRVLAQTTTPAEVNAVTWLGDNRQIVTGGADGLVRIWFLDRTRGELAAVKDLEGHEGPVTALDTVPTAEAQVLSGSGDGTVRLWNIEESRMVRLMKHGGPVTSVAARNDGKRFASAGLNNTAKLWEANEGRLVTTLKGDRTTQELAAEQERFAAFAKTEVEYQKGALESAETNQVAQADRVKKATESNDTAEKALAEKRKKFTETDDTRVAAQESLDETKAELKAAADALEAAKSAATEAEAAVKAARETAGATKEPLDTAVAKADEKLKSATETKANAEKRLNEIKAKEKQETDRLNAAAKALDEAGKEFKKAEQTKSNAETELGLATKASEQAAKAVEEAKEAVRRADAELQDAETNLQAGMRAVADSELPVRCLLFASDNLTLVSAGDDRCVRTWSAETGAPFDSFAGHQGAVFTVAFGPDGSLISGAADRGIVVWDSKPAWKLERTLGTGDIRSPLVDRVNALRFSPDGKWLATGGGEPSRSGEIELWDVATGRLSQSFSNVHSDVIFGLDFTRDARYLATSSADRFVRVLDVATGKVLKQFEGHTHHVLGVAWKRDGRTLASAGADNVVKLWNFITGDRKRNITGFDKEVTSVTFIGYTDQALATSGDGKVRLLREDGNEVRSFAGATDFVHTAAATSDGRIVIAGGQDSVLRVWDGTNGQLLASFPPPANK